MKLLALVFLVGFALAAAGPVPSHDLSLKEDDLESMLVLGADDTGEEMRKKLREQFDQILEKIKDAVEKGKNVKEEMLVQLKEIRQKMKDMNVDLGQKFKEIVEKIKEKAKDSLKKILDQLGLGQQYSDMHAETFMMLDEDEIKTELGKKLQESFNEILQKIKEAIEHGKGVKEEYLERLKEIREKLKDLHMDLGEKAREFMEKMKEKMKDKAKDFWKKILEKLGIDEHATDMQAETNGDDVKTELGKKLKERLDEILEKIKDAIENGKGVKADLIEKFKEIREKLRDMNMDFGEKVKKILEELKGKGNDYLKKILERLGLDKQATDMHAETNGMEADEDIKTELGKKIKKHLDEILEKIRDAVDHGKGVKEDLLNKLKETRQQLKDLGLDFGNKAKELLKELKEKAGDYWQKIFEKLGLDKQATDMHAETNRMEADVLEMEQRSFVALKEKLRILRDKVLENVDAGKIKAKIEELFDKGNELAEQLINKLKDKGHGHKESLLEFIDRLYEGRVEKRSIKDAFEKIKTFFRERQMELKEKFANFGKFVKERYAEALGKGKDKAENLKELARKFIKDGKDFSKEVLEEAKEFFHEYKQDLGTIYEDVRQKITEILNKKSE